MVSFVDVQKSLDRILGNASPGNHRAFWRGKTRDEFVAHKVFGFKVLEIGDPATSNLVRALKGDSPFGSDLPDPPADAIFPRMPAGQPPAPAEEIALIETWIGDGCTDQPAAATADGDLLALGLADGGAPSDDDHVAYWREVDLFFLPGLSNPVTARHVDNVHAAAFFEWRATKVLGTHPGAWAAYRALPEIQQSFEYVRVHQQRLISEYYGTSQDYLFDTLWKFGGNLLPPEPNDDGRPERRTMNGISDWSFWLPYLDMSLTQPDTSEADLRLARAWQVGIISDGLLRRRKAIPDFSANDPDLRQKVIAKYEAAPADALLPAMVARVSA